MDDAENEQHTIHIPIFVAETLTLKTDAPDGIELGGKENEEKSIITHCRSIINCDDDIVVMHRRRHCWFSERLQRWMERNRTSRIQVLIFLTPQLASILLLKTSLKKRHGTVLMTGVFLTLLWLVLTKRYCFHYL